MSATAVKSCPFKPIERLIDTRIVIEPGDYVAGFRHNPEQRHALLVNWANDVETFLRDHRSMDVNGVRAERITEKVCPSCGYDWNPDGDGVNNCCDAELVAWGRANPDTKRSAELLDTYYPGELTWPDEEAQR